MPRFVVSCLALASIACADPGPDLPAAGQACDVEAQCAAGLSCIRQICADDRGPQITVVLPEALQVFDETSSVPAAANVVDAGAGDQVEWTVDPGTGSAHTELVALTGDSADVVLALSAPLEIGPHHLRARLVDSDGTPYANPSATSEVVVFVSDPAFPDTPQVAIVWPPAGHVHRIANPLEIELAVRNFDIVDAPDDCPPLPDCEPEFDPQCEATCGPVSREGHVKIYAEFNYPACLLDTPIGCNGFYIMALRPLDDEVELIGANQIRATLQSMYFFEQPGTIPLTAALSYGYHDPYPSETGVIYETVSIELTD